MSFAHPLFLVYGNLSRCFQLFKKFNQRLNFYTLDFGLLKLHSTECVSGRLFEPTLYMVVSYFLSYLSSFCKKQLQPVPGLDYRQFKSN